MSATLVGALMSASSAISAMAGVRTTALGAWFSAGIPAGFRVIESIRPGSPETAFISILSTDSAPMTTGVSNST